MLVSEQYANRKLDLTARRGERNPNAKLTTEKVKEIKRRIKAGDRDYRGLGEEFGVASRTIRKIKNGHSWAWLDSENGP